MLNLSYKLFEIVPLVGSSVLADIFFLIAGRLPNVGALFAEGICNGRCGE